MKPEGGHVELDAQALFAQERQVPPLTATTRARAMARASASLEREVPPEMPVLVARPTRFRFALAAGVLGLCAVGGGAFAALWGSLARGRVRDEATSGKMIHQRAVAAPEAVTPAVADRALDRLVVAPAPEMKARAVLPARSRAVHASRAVANGDELLLLQRARAAISVRDYSRALLPLEEHGRQFQDGRLVEEREALRVRALAGLGRRAEAAKVANAFAARFPRSPLLSAVKRFSTRAP